MTKSTITRERIQRIMRAINSEAYDEEEIREWLSSDEIMELSRMALAAMDSESGCLHLDYLQGHKDGLEWAAKLAEANHPETGDWLYDDPIELAKAIRKGPDMPPAQPAADSEPVAWMHNNNNIGIPAITTSQKIGQYWMSEFKDVQPLYRHAQPAPVVPDAYVRDERGRMMLNGVCEPKIGFGIGWNACRAAMLQAGTLTNENTRQVDELTMWIKRLVRSLKNANPDSKLPRDAMDYLTAKGLISLGDVLR
ncbi:hypothetical protein A9L51_24105 [Klebsiella pneumoniae]|nr:hypothetical protein A9L51_24105 [Klebsiella pneumoniae]